MAEVELKRCPFCGREVSIRKNLRTSHTAIQCDYCRAWWTPAEPLTRNEIMGAWNRRLKMTAKEELLDCIQRMTKDEWEMLMVDDTLGENIIELLTLIGRQNGWL